MQDLIFLILFFGAGLIEIFLPHLVWKITYSFWSYPNKEPGKVLIIVTRIIGVFFIIVAIGGFYQYF